MAIREPTPREAEAAPVARALLTPEGAAAVATLEAEIDHATRERVPALVIEAGSLLLRSFARLAEPAPTTDPLDRWVDVKTCADYLGVSPDWLGRQEVPFRSRFGDGTVRYHLRGAKRWAERRLEGG